MKIRLYKIEDVFFLRVEAQMGSWTRCSQAGLGPVSSVEDPFDVCKKCSLLHNCPFEPRDGLSKSFIRLNECLDKTMISYRTDQTPKLNISKLATSLHSCASLEEAYIKLLETLGEPDADPV